MRWTYAATESELQDKAAIIEKIDYWWSAFEQRHEDIVASFEQGTDWLHGWMSETLHAIDERLCWEFGPGVRGGCRLVITPETERHLRPLVSTILNRAPSVNGWEFYPYRLAEDVDVACATVEARAGRSLEQTQFRAQIGEFNTIDLTFAAPDTESEEDEEALSMAFVASETLLGEQLLEQWIGEISVEHLPKPGLLGGLMGKSKHYKSLASLKGTVDALITSMHDQLLPDSWHAVAEDDRKYAAIEFCPQQEQDYADRDDLIAATSAYADVTVALHQSLRFYSTRFSKHGETFCYLKTEASPEEMRVDDRAKFEDALDTELIPAKHGSTLGGGGGIKYAYIDLALSDLESSIRQIHDVAQAHGLSKRSWLMFFEDDLCAEWIGMWDDSPAPPGM